MHYQWSRSFYTEAPILSRTPGAGGLELASVLNLCLPVHSYRPSNGSAGSAMIQAPIFFTFCPSSFPYFQDQFKYIRIKQWQQQQQQKQQSKEAFNGVNSSHISTARGLEGPFHSSVVWEKAIRKEEKGWSSGEICGRNGLDRQQAVFSWRSLRLNSFVCATIRGCHVTESCPVECANVIEMSIFGLALSKPSTTALSSELSLYLSPLCY